MTDETTYAVGAEVTYLGRPAVVFTDPAVGATGATLVGVRFTDVERWDDDDVFGRRPARGASVIANVADLEHRLADPVAEALRGVDISTKGSLAGGLVGPDDAAHPVQGTIRRNLGRDRYFVDDLQAVEPDALEAVEGIVVTVADDPDSMGFPRVEVEAPSREALLDYVRSQWGDDDPVWFAEYVEARICARADR